MIPASDFKIFKQKPMVVATAYDYPFARILEEAGVDVILVGDSLANVVLGFSSTREVGMDVMSVFVAAAARGAPHTHIVADMPYGSDATPVVAVTNARRFLSLGAHSVKLEGAKMEAVAALIAEGIPVVGHLGLLPQTAKSLRQVGHELSERDDVLRSAEALAKAGAAALVLEHMDFALADEVTRRIPIPTIGIGAGAGVNGQVLVLHDILGLNFRPLPPFAKAFASLRESALQGMREYCEAVRSGSFP